MPTQIPKSLTLPVKKIPMTELTDGLRFNNGLTHAIVIETDDGPVMVNACSKNYTLMTNAEVFGPIIKGMDSTHDIELKVRTRYHSKFYVDVVIKDKALLTKKDMVYPRVRFMNSYDGSLKYSFSFGFYRVVCSNGLAVPVEGMSSKTIKAMHTPSILDRWEKAEEKIRDFLKDSKELTDGYRTLQERKLTLDEAIQRIQEVVKNTKAPTSRMEGMVNRLRAEVNSGLPPSDWLVYNAVNYELNHGGLNTAPHKLDKVDNQVLKYIFDTE